MAKKKDTQELVPFEEIKALESGYKERLDTDLKYSLMVDPEDKYGMSDTQKLFVANYVQFKNIPLAAQLTDIDEDTAKSYFMSYATQQEIRRINLAMNQRKFATKLLSLDEIGGYLTASLMDENTAIVDQYKPKEKLEIAKLIIEVNKLKQNALTQPIIMDAVDIQEQLQDLSVDTIQRLIDTSTTREAREDKTNLVNQIKENNSLLTPEELSYLKTLSSEDLLKILDDKGNKE